MHSKGRQENKQGENMEMRLIIFASKEDIHHYELLDQKPT